MKAKLTAICVAISAGTMLAAAAVAADIGTRSSDDAHADLMRTWQSHGGKPAGYVKTRNIADRYADMMRDWDGRLTRSAGTIVGVADTAAPNLTGGDRSMDVAGFGRR